LTATSFTLTKIWAAAKGQYAFGRTDEQFRGPLILLQKFLQVIDSVMARLKSYPDASCSSKAILQEALFVHFILIC
jgi:hypothetical protein